MTSAVTKTAAKALEDNKQLLTTAAIVEAGRIANNKIAKLAGEHLPAPANLLLATPFGQLILANLVKLAGDQFKPGDQMIERLTNGMVVAAYGDLIQQFDFEGIIDQLIGDKGVKAALKRAETTAE